MVSQLEERYLRVRDRLSPEELALKQKYEGSLYEFIKQAWYEIEPGFTYVDNWHIKAICDHLEAAYQGDISRLLINIPSRCMKSTICNIGFPAWVWAKEPRLKFLNVSGDFLLSVRDNVKCRRLIQSPWFQKYWGDKVRIAEDNNTKKRYGNTAGGEKLIKTIQGSAMGEGANFVIVDDGNSSKDIFSTVRREFTNEVIDSTITVRIDRISADRAGCFINIQQRLHQFDITGHWLAKGDSSVVHLMLPMEFEAKRKCITIPLKGSKIAWEDPRKEEGELLWPARCDAEELAKRKIGYGSAYTQAAQLQQNPTPAGGHIIKRNWFQEWKHPTFPKIQYIIQSWDTALSVAEDACDSAVTTWGVFQNEYGNNNIILMHCWSGKLENPDLRKMIKRCANNFDTYNYKISGTGRAPDIVLIEKAANGLALIQDLWRAGIQVTAFDPKNHGFKPESGISPTSKIARTHYASVLIEQGLVWIPMQPGPLHTFDRPYQFAEKFIDACLRYPRGTGKDLLDSMSQSFIWVKARNLLHNPGEEPEPAPFDYSEHTY